MQALVIDGGGSHTTFAITDESGNILDKFRIEQGSNPWKQGVDRTCNVFSEGVNRIDTTDIAVCVAGISGCHEETPLNTQLRAHLALLMPNARIILTGDMSTALRSMPGIMHGIVALAGSGSSIFFETPDHQHGMYSSVGYGGKDIAVMLVQTAQQQRLGLATTAWLQSYYDKPLDTMSLDEFYQHPATVATISLDLTNHTDPAIIEDVAPVIDAAGARWAYKIWNAYRNYLALTPDSPYVDLVLSGGAWGLERMRKTTVAELTRATNTLTIHYNPARTPLDGAIAIAVDELRAIQ